VQQKEFMQDLCLLIVKSHSPMKFMESIWMEQALHLCPQTPFPSRFFFQ
jgi:hypothetical protein